MQSSQPKPDNSGSQLKAPIAQSSKTGQGVPTNTDSMNIARTQTAPPTFTPDVSGQPKPQGSFTNFPSQSNPSNTAANLNLSASAFVPKAKAAAQSITPASNTGSFAQPQTSSQSFVPSNTSSFTPSESQPFKPATTASEPVKAAGNLNTTASEFKPQGKTQSATITVPQQPLQQTQGYSAYPTQYGGGYQQQYQPQQYQPQQYGQYPQQANYNNYQQQQIYPSGQYSGYNQYQQPGYGGGYQQPQYPQQMHHQPILQPIPSAQPIAPITNLKSDAPSFLPSSKLSSKANSPRGNTSTTTTQGGFFAYAQPDIKAKNGETLNKNDFKIANVAIAQVDQSAPSTQSTASLNKGATEFRPVKMPQTQGVTQGAQPAYAQSQQNTQNQSFKTPKQQVPAQQQPQARKDAPRSSKDPLSAKLEDKGMSGDEISTFKTLLDKLKQSKRLSRELLLSFKDFSLTKQQPPSYWQGVKTRASSVRVLEQKSYGNKNYNKPNNRGNYQGGAGGGQYNRGNQRPQPYDKPQNAEGGGFQKNVRKPDIQRERNPSPGDMLKRSEADDFRKKLEKESKQKFEEVKKDRNVIQQIRMICNMIAPDNFEKKFLELRGLMFGELKYQGEDGFNPDIHKVLSETLNQDNMEMIVQTVFRKAQNEKEYVSFYGELCEKLIKLELSLRGYPPGRAGRIVKNTAKHSEVRKNLLEYCRKSFDQFFDKTKLAEKKDQEEEIKFKHRLFGNIMFVGELNKRGLLAESIMISIFDMLIVIQGNDESRLELVNDDTIEGACVLMNKIGYLIDEKISKLTKEDKKEDKKEEKKRAALREKNDQQVKEYLNIFKRFEDLSYNDDANVKVSQRVRLLLKNMLENRASGWEKSKKQNESGPKKVEELRREMEAKAREEERARQAAEYDEQQYSDQYGGGGRYNQRDNRDREGGRGGRGGRRDGKQQYQQKSNYQSRDNYEESGSSRTVRQGSVKEVSTPSGKYVAKKSASQFFEETKPISDEEMAKKIMGNFHNYQAKGESIPEEDTQEETKTTNKNATNKDFSIYSDLQKINGKQAEDIFYTFLNKVYDSSEHEIEEILPQYLEDWLKTSSSIKPDAIAKGVSRFLKVIPDQVNDVPKLSSYFAQTLFVLISLQAIEPSDIIWFEAPAKQVGEEEDEMVFVEEYYKLMAQLLVHQYEKTGNWKDVESLFNKNFKASFDVLHPKILEDNLFKDIESEIGSTNAKVIVPLLNKSQ